MSENDRERQAGIFHESIDLPINRYEKNWFLKVTFLLVCPTAWVVFLQQVLFPPYVPVSIKCLCFLICVHVFRILVSTTEYYRLARQTKGRDIVLGEGKITFEEQIFDENEYNSPVTHSVLLSDCFWREGYEENDSFYGPVFARLIWREKRIEICFADEKSLSQHSILTCGQTEESRSRWCTLLESQEVRRWKGGCRFQPLLAYLVFAVGCWMSCFLFERFSDCIDVFPRYFQYLGLELLVVLPFALAYGTRCACHDYLYVNIPQKTLILVIVLACLLFQPLLLSL